MERNQKALVTDWHWTNVDASLPYMFYSAVYAFYAIFAGKLQDQFGPRLIASIGGLALGSGLTRVLQLLKGEKPLIAETSGFSQLQICKKFVMLQSNMFQEFVKHLLPRINIVEIRANVPCIAL